MTTSTLSPRYVPVADQAKLVRGALKQAFPGVKFSVRSSSFAGGSAIDVRWTDGPRSRDVDAVTGAYRGGDFDGSIDLAYGRTHFLRSDGRVYVARDEGSEGSGGQHPAEDNRSLHALMPADVEEVRFAAHYISCQREISDRPAKLAEANAYLRQHCTLEANGTRFGNRWVDDLATAIVYDRAEGESLEASFRRVLNID